MPQELGLHTVCTDVCVLLYAKADIMLCGFAAVEQRHMHILRCMHRGVEEARECKWAREGGRRGGAGGGGGAAHVCTETRRKGR